MNPSRVRVACVTAAVVLALILSTSGTGKGSAAFELAEGGNVPPTSSEGDTTSLTQQVVDGIVRLRDQGSATFPESYGGIASGNGDDDDVLVVYLTSLDAKTEHDVIAFSGVPAEKVRFERAAMTRLDAEAMDERFSVGAPALQAEGFELRGWGIGRDVTYEVQLAPPEPGKASLFEEQARSLSGTAETS